MSMTGYPKPRPTQSFAPPRPTSAGESAPARPAAAAKETPGSSPAGLAAAKAQFVPSKPGKAPIAMRRGTEGLLPPRATLSGDQSPYAQALKMRARSGKPGTPSDADAAKLLQEYREAGRLLAQLAASGKALLAAHSVEPAVLQAWLDTVFVTHQTSLQSFVHAATADCNAPAPLLRLAHAIGNVLEQGLAATSAYNVPGAARRELLIEAVLVVSKAAQLASDAL